MQTKTKTRMINIHKNFKIMQKKKMYEQPRTEVVELRVMNQLLAGSAGLSGLDSFGGGGDPLGGGARVDDYNELDELNKMLNF